MANTDGDFFVIENPQLLEAFKIEPSKVLPFLHDAMVDVTFLIQAQLGYANGYAPASEANQPGRVNAEGEPLGYYERNRGWWYPVKRPETLGGMNSVGEGAQTLDSALRRHKMKNVATTSKLVVRAGGVTIKHGVPILQAVNVVEERRNVVAGYKLAKNKNGQRGTSEQLGKNWTTRVTADATMVQGEVGTPVSYADFVQGFNVTDLHKSRGWVDMDTRVEQLVPAIEERVDRALEDYLINFQESK